MGYLNEIFFYFSDMKKVRIMKNSHFPIFNSNKKINIYIFFGNIVIQKSCFNIYYLLKLLFSLLWLIKMR